MPTKHDVALRTEIIAVACDMARTGLTFGTAGNISVRVDGGFLVTPSGIPYEKTTPDQIVFCDLDGGYEGEWMPSVEWRLHRDIYLNLPAAQAVVHVHSPYATALSCLRIDIPAFHYMIGKQGGPTLRTARYATFGTAELSDAMIEALADDRTACLLANHGQIAYGKSLAQAYSVAGEVEYLCRQYAIVRTLGTPVILDDTEMTEVMRRFRTYGKQPRDCTPEEVAMMDRPVRRDG
ncbi:class II aldolase [Prosthecomicrobium hirschii]|uniref:class II aldolase/adducin family protein n=1 Tax=Prosthecodimorpha hirschii TaxID=665126 RepID=UPI00112AE05D|nr:class II aldolase/adducin family protein [Prosthecomicrobium hirschii]TPQ52153.1 class II aldolase [Prosthecomicrobium hirschii]